MPPPAPVIEFKPVPNASLFTMTPSTTYSGWNAPFTVLLPRIWSCTPPPGAPLFCVITAPGTLPCSAFSMFCCGTRFTSSLLTTVTALAAFWLDTVVA